jgi:hypothetical protein
MIFTDIPTGAFVFLDANTFIYHFTPDPVLGPPCSDLFIRIKRQELDGWTSTHVLVVRIELPSNASQKTPATSDLTHATIVIFPRGLDPSRVFNHHLREG